MASLNLVLAKCSEVFPGNVEKSAEYASILRAYLREFPSDWDSVLAMDPGALKIFLDNWKQFAAGAAAAPVAAAAAAPPAAGLGKVKNLVKEFLFLVLDAEGRFVGNGCVALLGGKPYALTAYHTFSEHDLSVVRGAQHTFSFPRGDATRIDAADTHLFEVFWGDKRLDVLILTPADESWTCGLLIAAPADESPVGLVGYPVAFTSLPRTLNLKLTYNAGVVSAVDDVSFTYTAPSFSSLSGASVVICNGELIGIHAATANEIAGLPKRRKPELDDLISSASSAERNTCAVAVAVRVDILAEKVAKMRTRKRKRS